MRRLAGLLLTGVLLTAQAEDPPTVAPAAPAVTLAVVVAADDLRAQIDRSVLSLVYRRKRQFWPDGRRIHPINLPAAHPLRVQFSQQVLGANPAALVDDWNAEYFLGVLPPFVAASPEALATRVAQTPGAVGYVSACAVDARLRVLFYLPPNGAGETGAPDCPDRNL